MSEIWNLSALCRCCHKDGDFKSLETAIVCSGELAVCSSMLLDTFGLHIQNPMAETSYNICEQCIQRLQDAYQFKKQVSLCEEKFLEYCKNEQFVTTTDCLKIELEDDDAFDYAIDSTDMKTELIDVKAEKDFKQEKIKNEDNSCKVEISINLKKSCKTGKTKAAKKKQDGKKPKSNKSNNYDVSYEMVVETEDGEVFSCKTCGGRYEDKKQLKKHIKTVHCKTQYSCEICNETFDNYTQKYRHKSVHKGMNFTCEVCGKIAKTFQYHKYHVATHTKTKSVQCDICQKWFYYKKSLINHFKLHYGTSKKAVCHLCGRGFNDMTNMLIHIRTVHEKLRPFSCNLCQKVFSAKKHLNVHLRRHAGDKPHNCEICNKSFYLLSDMKKHTCIHNQAVGSSFRCKLCNTTFKTRGELVKHSKTHIGKKPLICTICNKDFSCKYSLNRHVYNHSGQKPHHCDMCEAKFSDKSLLKRHKQRKHTFKEESEKKKCEICKKYVANLEMHIERHNNRPFGCEFCEKRYTERTALNRHVANIHYGRKAHACDLCEKKYRQLKTLRIHKMKVHKMATKTEAEENFDSVVTKYTLSKRKKRNPEEGYLYIDADSGLLTSV